MKTFSFLVLFLCLTCSLFPSKTQPCLGQCNDNNSFITQQDTIMQKISCLIHNVIITITRFILQHELNKAGQHFNNRQKVNNIISMFSFFSTSLTPSYQQTIIPTTTFIHIFTFV